MTEFDHEFGVQFTIHIADQYTVPELVELADTALSCGMNQVWVNDNLGYRNVFVVLGAIASKVPVALGTAIMVPYYRNPVDVAGTITALTELMDDREISIGIGRGSLAQTGYQVETPKPYRMIRETVECHKALLSGEKITFGDYPLLASYFNLRPDAELAMSVSPSAPVRFYMGGHGPTALTVAGKFLDGLVLGGYFLPLAKSGQLSERFAIADEAAREGGTGNRLKRVTELNISIADDPKEAQEFPKPYVTHLLMGMKKLGFSSADFVDLGIDPKGIEDIAAAFDQGATIQEAAELVTEEMVNATFIAGDPDDCREQFEDLLETIPTHEIDQLVFAKLGPDYERALDLISDHLMSQLQ